MTAEYVQAMDRWVEEFRAAYGIPPALVRRVDTCRNCGQTIQGGNTSTGWTHIGDWRGVRCQGALTGAAPQTEAPQRSPEETLDQLDAAVEGRCAGPGCSQALNEHSASAYFCGSTCQEVWQQHQAGRPSPGSAPVRGSEGVDASHMRWRPDLVTAFDDTGLTLLDRHHRDDTGLDYCVYNRADSDRVFLRVDDGHRFVGIEVPWPELEASGPSEPFRRLERELTDRRRLDPQRRHYPSVIPVAGPDRGVVREWLRTNGIDPDEVPAGAWIEVSDGMIRCDVQRRMPDGGLRRERVEVRHRCRPPWPGTGPCPNCVDRCEPGCGCTCWGTAAAARPPTAVTVDPQPGNRAAGAVFWLPDRPADPEAPTAAELAGGVDLTPFLAPVDARPTATWVDETHWAAAGRPRGCRRMSHWLRVQSDRLRDLPGRVERWLFPLAYCPIHGRRTCAMCDWPDWRAIAAAHRGGPYRRRLRTRLHVDARRFEEGMAQASEAFRRAGETVAEFGARLAGAYQSLPSETRQAVQDMAEAESDRVALRAVCADEAMYERALAEAQASGRSVRQMMAAVAAGEYTESGWVLREGGIDDR